MSGMQGLKNRIKSVDDTAKITNAMYLISSTKLQKARKELAQTRPFFNELRLRIKRLFHHSTDLESPYFFEGERKEIDPALKFAIIVVTADKGMAGAYNHNILKLTEWLLSKQPGSKVFVLGEFGRKALANKGIEFEKDFLYTAQRPTLKTSREIADRMIDLYDRKEVDRIYILYTDMKSALAAEPTMDLILPFVKEDFDIWGDDKNDEPSSFEFIPSREVVLEKIVHSYVTGFIYSAIVDSFCSEQNARMAAMSAANDNANNISNELQMLYNRMRQGEITNEIIEVSAGAKAQSMHKKKEKK